MEQKWHLKCTPFLPASRSSVQGFCPTCVQYGQRTGVHMKMISKLRTPQPHQMKARIRFHLSGFNVVTMLLTSIYPPSIGRGNMLFSSPAGRSKISYAKLKAPDPLRNCWEWCVCSRLFSKNIITSIISVVHQILQSSLSNSRSIVFFLIMCGKFTLPVFRPCWCGLICVFPLIERLNKLQIINAPFSRSMGARSGIFALDGKIMTASQTGSQFSFSRAGKWCTPSLKHMIKMHLFK